ncbi:xylulokinase [Cohnella hongkongensis]|uniref:FGGY-family carbohydrate kinase n=1 Tax=Cohnella hongkongensis TaxID=178337 RepID=A0ABV9FIL5_9BACL
MVRKEAILTFDIGTSSLKACLWNDEGGVVATEQAGYDVELGPGGEAEQNPEDWLRAAFDTSASLMERFGAAYEVAAIGLTGQMSGCVLADSEGRARLPAMTWQDRRSASVIQPLSPAFAEGQFYEWTGQRFDAGLPFAKLMWIQTRYPELIAGSTMFDAQNWLAFRLTGARVTDISNASGTGMMNIRTREWSDEVCRALKLPADVLPRIVPSSAIAGRLLQAPAAKLGLASGIPVIIGMGDGPSSCLGLGIAEFGQGYCQIGTSAWISTYSNRPPERGDQGLMAYAYGHGYVPTGSMQAAGQALAWAEEWLDGAKLGSYPDSKLPYHLPYMFGERSPHWFSEPRGTFFQLASWHGKTEIYTSVFEGVAFQLRMIKDIFRKRGLLAPDQPLLVSGGLLRAPDMPERLATLLGESVRVADDPVSSTSLGAFFCAKAGIEGKDPLRLAAAPGSHLVSGQDRDGIVSDRYARFLRYVDLICDGD